MVKRRKRPVPIALLWTRRDQLRFTDTVERLVSVVGDLVVIVEDLKRQRAAAPRPRRVKAAPPADGQAAMADAGPAP